MRMLTSFAVAMLSVVIGGCSAFDRLHDTSGFTTIKAYMMPEKTGSVTAHKGLDTFAHESLTALGYTKVENPYCNTPSYENINAEPEDVGVQQMDNKQLYIVMLPASEFQGELKSVRNYYAARACVGISLGTWQEEEFAMSVQGYVPSALALTDNHVCKMLKQRGEKNVVQSTARALRAEAEALHLKAESLREEATKLNRLEKANALKTIASMDLEGKMFTSRATLLTHCLTMR